MKSHIAIFRPHDQNKSYLICCNQIECNDYGEPYFIWKDIQQVINDCKNNGTTLIYENFIKWLLSFSKYSENIEEGNEWIDYYIDIIYEDTIIEITAYNKVNYDKKIECFKERYVISSNNEGNCIDDFITRGIKPCLENIEQLTKSIEDRLPERQMSVEYHKTWCYEKDFAQISLIQKQAERIVKNCTKHLERISEFYTRL